MTARKRMSQAARAKQFMPFAALKGYDIALRAKEKIIVPKIELSEDMAEELDRKFRQIQKHDIVTVVYFSRDRDLLQGLDQEQGEYLKITGMISRLDPTAKVLQIVNTKIGFEDIYNLSFDSCKHTSAVSLAKVLGCGVEDPLENSTAEAE